MSNVNRVPGCTNVSLCQLAYHPQRLRKLQFQRLLRASPMLQKQVFRWKDLLILLLALKRRTLSNTGASLGGSYVERRLEY